MVTAALGFGCAGNSSHVSKPTSDHDWTNPATHDSESTTGSGDHSPTQVPKRCDDPDAAHDMITIGECHSDKTSNVGTDVIHSAPLWEARFAQKPTVLAVANASITGENGSVEIDRVQGVAPG